MPTGAQTCICSQEFDYFKEFYFHRHEFWFGSNKCPLAAVPWDEYEGYSEDMLMTCVCGKSYDKYDALHEHATSCSTNQKIFKARFPGQHEQDKPKVAYTIEVDIFNPAQRKATSAELVKKLDERKGLAIPTDWDRYLRDLDKAIFWDMEAVSSSLYPLLAHVFTADAKGHTLVNCVMDDGSFDDLWAARDRYEGRTRRRIYEGLVRKYYGPGQTEAIARLPRVIIKQLAAALEQLNIRNKMALKWSTNGFDWYALWRTLDAIGKEDCLPPLENVVKPLIIIRKMYGLSRVVPMALERLFALSFPKSELVGTLHLVDVDVTKLYKVIRLFQGRNIAMKLDGRIALGFTQVSEDDEEPIEKELSERSPAFWQ